MKALPCFKALVAVALVATAAPSIAKPATGTRGVVYYPRSDDLPFSEAVRVDNRLVLNGQIGVSNDGKTVVPGGWESETRRAMDLIGVTLKKHGLGYNDITWCSIMLVDIDQWASFNSVYGSYFRKGHYPARVVSGATGLPRGGHVEIACQAYFRS